MVRSLGHYDGHTGIEGFDSPSIHAREGCCYLTYLGLIELDSPTAVGHMGCKARRGARAGFRNSSLHTAERFESAPSHDRAVARGAWPHKESALKLSTASRIRSVRHPCLDRVAQFNSRDGCARFRLPTGH